MKTTFFIAVLAMLAMVNAVPIQEEKNLQGLLNVLEDQKESTTQVANLVKQQQDDDGSQEAGAQFFRKLLSLYANKQDGRAEAQIIGRLIKSFWANKQQDDDNGNQADAQFLGRIIRHFYANKQQDDDNADAQFWGALARLGLKYAAPHAVNYLTKKLG